MNWSLATAPAWMEGLARLSLQASVLAVLVYVAIVLLRKWITPAACFALWGLVLVRLALPISWESHLSLLNLLPGTDVRPLPVAEGSPSVIAPLERDGAGDSGRKPSVGPVQRAGADLQTQLDAPREVSGVSARLGVWDGLALLWLGVVIGLAGWNITQFVGFSRRVRADWRACRHLDEELRCAAKVLGVHRRVQTVETAAVSSPALYGFRHPWILVPQGFTEKLGPEGRRWVFLHELAHLRRCDTLLLWCIQGVCAAHWFNPVVWWVARRMGEARELACDALVLSKLDPDSRERYGLTIVQLAAEDVLPAHVPGMLSHAQKKRNLERRVHMIANYRRSRAGILIATTVLLVLVLVGFTDGVTQAADPDAGAGGDRTVLLSAHEAAQALVALGATVEYEGGDTNGVPVSVQLDQGGIKDADLAPLASLPTLTNLWLRGFRASVISDETLSYIGGLTNLRSLRFYGTVRFTPEGLAQLKDLKRLEKFNLGDSDIPDAGLDVLAELDSLNFFWMAGLGARFWGDRITDQGCSKLAEITGLTGLGLLNTGIGPQGVLQLGTLTNLTWLNLGANPLITDEAAQAFGQWSRLETLWLFDVSVGDACLEQIGKMKELEQLDLAGTRISDRGLKHVSNLPKLRHLILGGSHTPNLSLGFTDVGDEGLAGMTDLPNLAGITLERTKVTDAGLRHLARFPALKTIWLGYTEITGSRFGDLAELPNLAGMDLEGTKVTDDGLANLRHLKSLQGVSVVGTAVTDAGLEHLKTLESLRGVNLKGTKVTAEGVEALRSARTNLVVNWP